MSKLHLVTLVATLSLAGAAQANGPAGYDPLAFVQADIAQAQQAAKAEPVKKELAKSEPAKTEPAKAEPKKLDWRKFIPPVAQGNGPAGYDPLAFVKAEEAATKAPQAPQYAARTAK